MHSQQALAQGLAWGKPVLGGSSSCQQWGHGRSAAPRPLKESAVTTGLVNCQRDTGREIQLIQLWPSLEEGTSTHVLREILTSEDAMSTQ